MGRQRSPSRNILAGTTEPALIPGAAANYVANTVTGHCSCRVARWRNSQQLVGVIHAVGYVVASHACHAVLIDHVYATVKSAK